MTKSELLADLAAKSGGTVLQTQEVETIANVKRYLATVMTRGLEDNASPIGDIYSIYFFVQDEGEAEEEAWYKSAGFKNPMERNPTGSTLVAIYGIFSNQILRERVTAAVAKAIRIKMAGTPSDADKKVAKAFITDLNGLIDLFMAYVASNSTIQLNGGAATDSDLDYVVQDAAEAWSNVGAALETETEAYTETETEGEIEGA